MSVISVRWRLSTVGVLAAGAVVGGVITAPVSAGAPADRAPAPAAAAVAAAPYAPPAAVNRTPVGGSPQSAWTPTATPTSGAKSSAVNPATTAVAGLNPINGGTPAGGPGLGSQAFYGLETFPLSEGLSAQVNLSTGNLVAHSQDLALNAPGLSVRLDRFYNNLSTGAGSAGAKSVLSTGRDVGLQFTPTGATFYGPSGFTADFVRKADGLTFDPPLGMNADLVQSGAFPGDLVLTYRKTGEKLTFNYFGYLMADTDRNGTGVSFAYDVFDPAFPLVAVTDAAGRVTTVNAPGGRTASITDPAGRVLTYTYDGGGRLTASTAPGGRVTHYTYDGANNLTAVQAPGGNWTSFTYDPAGRVTSVNRYTTAGANSGDAATTTFAYGTTDKGEPRTTQTNPLGQNSTYILDSSGRVLSATDPLGRSRSVSWTANSDVETAVDAMGTGESSPGNTTRYTYDPATNNLTKAELPTGAAARAQYAIGPDGQGGTCQANNSGTPFQPRCTTNPQGNQTQMAYDGNGNVFSTADSTAGGLGGARSVFREFPGFFDAHCGAKIGQVCFTRTPYGVDTHYDYNPNGDLIKVTPPAPLGATTYAYDSLSRVTAVTDGKGQTATFTYDAADRVLATSYAGAGTITNTYDADGQTLTRTDTTGANSSYTYDGLGRQTSTTVPGAAPNVISVAYDKAGNVTSYTDKNGTTGYTYDEANQLVALAEPGGNCAPTPGTKCTRFGYNANGARESTTYPGGTEQKATLDKSGRAKALKVTAAGGQVLSDLSYIYATVPGLEGDRSVLQTRTTAVDPAGVIPPGASSTYTYNSHGNLTNATEKLPSGGVNASWGYAYDQSGNRLHTTSIVPGGQRFDTDYGYNGADQVINRNWWPFDWAHDPNGNQTTVPGTGAIPGIAGTPANNNTLNSRDQITQTVSNGAPVNFSYAGGSNNTRLSAGATSFQSGVLGQASQTTGGAATAFTRTPGGSLVSLRTATGSAYYLTDNQGSVIGMVNDQGQKVAGYAYTPYGETRATTGTAAASNPYRYTGGYLDATSNLYKLGYRYYDARQGRFTQQDPSGQEANPYLYANGDPANNADPNGLYCVFGTYGGPGGACRGGSLTKAADPVPSSKTSEENCGLASSAGAVLGAPIGALGGSKGVMATAGFGAGLVGGACVNQSKDSGPALLDAVRGGLYGGANPIDGVIGYY